MGAQSTNRPPAWRLFWVTASVLALGAGCSGSADDASSTPPSTASPVRPPATRVVPPVVPTIPTITTPPTVRRPTGVGNQRVVYVPRSINATGRVNVTERLQAFLDRVPDGRVIRFRHNGRYRAEGTLFVSHRNNLVIDGNGATLFATIGGAPDRSQWWLKDSRTIVFRDLDVRGANPKGGTSEGAYNVEQETQHGFRMEGVDGVELDDVRVSDVYGDFVYIGRDKDRVPSQNVWIHDSDFRRNGRQGIAITAATNVIIERNTIDHTRRSTIDLEPNARSWHISNVFVLNNTVGKGRLLFIASHGQGPVDNIVISGNRLVGHPLTIDALPPEGKRRSNWIVTDNVSDMPVHSRPMRFFAIDGLVVAGNTQLVSGGQPGVILTDDCGTRVSGNDFGRAEITRHGQECSAELTVPVEPAILDRNAPPPPTTTTQPPPGSTVPPASTVPGSTVAPVPTTVAPVPADGGSGGGNGLAVGLLIAVAVLLIAGAGYWFSVRARMRPGRPPAP